MTLTAVAARHVTFTAWRGPDGLAAGSHLGTVVRDGRLACGCAAGTFSLRRPLRRPSRRPRSATSGPRGSPRRWSAASRRPSWCRPGTPRRPDDSWLLVEARTATGHDSAGAAGPAGSASPAGPTPTARSTPPPCPGRPTRPPAWRPTCSRPATAFTAYQLRVTLPAGPAAAARPTVRMLGGDGLPGARPRRPRTCPPAAWRGASSCRCRRTPSSCTAATTSHWDRGGRSWCSPTSTSMLLAFHDRLPAPGDYAWVEPGVPGPVRGAGRPARLRLRLRAAPGTGRSTPPTPAGTAPTRSSPGCAR